MNAFLRVRRGFPLAYVFQVQIQTCKHSFQKLMLIALRFTRQGVLNLSAQLIVGVFFFCSFVSIWRKWIMCHSWEYLTSLPMFFTPILYISYLHRVLFTVFCFAYKRWPTWADKGQTGGGDKGQTWRQMGQMDVLQFHVEVLLRHLDRNI